jgi:hypothetical protein
VPAPACAFPRLRFARHPPASAEPAPRTPRQRARAAPTAPAAVGRGVVHPALAPCTRATALALRQSSARRRASSVRSLDEYAATRARCGNPCSAVAHGRARMRVGNIGFAGAPRFKARPAWRWVAVLPHPVELCRAIEEQAVRFACVGARAEGRAPREQAPGGRSCVPCALAPRRDAGVRAHRPAPKGGWLPTSTNGNCPAIPGRGAPPKRLASGRVRWTRRGECALLAGRDAR